MTAFTVHWDVISEATQNPCQRGSDLLLLRQPALILLTAVEQARHAAGCQLRSLFSR